MITLYKEYAIGVKKLSDADLGRDSSQSSQTHIGLSEKVLTFLPNEPIELDGVLLFNNSGSSVQCAFSKINNQRSTKVDTTTTNPNKSLVTQIRNIASNASFQWYLVWFALEDQTPVFWLMNDQSNDFNEIKEFLDGVSSSTTYYSNSKKVKKDVYYHILSALRSVQKYEDYISQRYDFTQGNRLIASSPEHRTFVHLCLDYFRANKCLDKMLPFFNTKNANIPIQIISSEGKYKLTNMFMFATETEIEGRNEQRTRWYTDPFVVDGRDLYLYVDWYPGQDRNGNDLQLMIPDFVNFIKDCFGDKYIYRNAQMTHELWMINDPDNVNADNEQKTLSLENLGEILQNMYDDTSTTKVNSIYMFAIKYGKHIIDGNYSAQKIIDQTTLPSTYSVELGKGINIYKALHELDDGNVGIIDGGETVVPLSFTTDLPLQTIYYGAPGTGKSHTIQLMEQDEDDPLTCIRTTFHPDSDYSTFVGCYKPIMDKDDPKMIRYQFVEQAFMQTYLAAWSNPEKKYALVIEEINRGNCAQIFGDIFQLLDRDEDGWSTYPIKADADIADHIESKNIKGYKETLADRYGDDKGDFSFMALPPNMSLLATMNTSDQSLFPIDSAFKRRWDWEYVPICDAHEGWKIKTSGLYFDWYDFLIKINDRIELATSSEDKQLGFFFCKADRNDVISAKRFVDKVLFYLWNDVFKDFADDNNDVFKIKGEQERLTFRKFYAVENRKTVVVEENVKKFLEELGLVGVTNFEKEENVEEDTSKSKGHLKVTFPDGEVIEDAIANNVLIDTIRKIGPAKVGELHINLYGYDFVSKDKISDAGYGKFQREVGDGYYVITQLNNPNKKRKLDEISAALDLGLIVEIVDEQGIPQPDEDTDVDSKEPGSKRMLHVEFEDETIAIKRFPQYLEVVKKIGLEKVEAVASEKKVTVLGCALVTREPEPAIENQHSGYSYVKEGDFYVVKGIKGPVMLDFLPLVSERYDLGLKIEYRYVNR